MLEKSTFACVCSWEMYLKVITVVVKKQPHPSSKATVYLTLQTAGNCNFFFVAFCLLKQQL